MNNATERKRKERATKRAAGFVPKSFWIRPEDVEKVEKLIRKYGYDFYKEKESSKK